MLLEFNPQTIPYIDDATLAQETANTFLGDVSVKQQRAACREWVRGPVPKDVHELVRSTVRSCCCPERATL